MTNARKIILISIDTLRADHLGCYGYKKPTSPFLDSLAAAGTRFERHYATDVPTPPSYTALFTGQRGLKNGILGFGQMPNELRTKNPFIGEHFAAAGFRTGAISNLLYPMPWLARGFHDLVPIGLRFQKGLADDVTKEAATWLKTHHQKDFFLFVHYWDPHSPYYKSPAEYQKMFAPEDYRGEVPDLRYVEGNDIINAYYTNYHNVVARGERRPEQLMAWYDSCIRYADDSIKKLFRLLEELKIARDTLVAITSDHGESFGEYGFFDHISCYENIAHIPLIFRWPGKIPVRRVKGLTGGIDVMPTLLEYAGLPVPENICGRSLRPAVSGKGGGCREEIVVNTAAAMIQRMYVKGDWALVHSLSRPGYHHIKEYELFNLAGKDRWLEDDLSKKESRRCGQMRLALGDWLARELNGGPDLLQGWVEKGGWAWIGIQRILHKNAGVILKDPDLRRICLHKFGIATRWLEKGEFEYESYYPGM